MNIASNARSVVLGAIGLSVLVGAVASTDAAAEGSRAHAYTATAVCEAPLPIYDATLRKRTRGILNEGSSPIFISCSVPGDNVGDQTTGTLAVYFQSFGSANATVNCTLNAGSRLGGAGSVAGSTVVGPGGDGNIIWSSVDKVTYYGAYNVSCNVPGNIEMGMIWLSETDDGNAL
jgi:hypothetical protein